MQFTTKSGSKVVINQASFQEAMALKNAVASEFSKSSVKLDFKGSLTETEFDLADLIKAFFQIDSSEQVQKAVFGCLARCLRNGEKITMDTFENDPDARKDYYEIVIACVKENLSPFFSGLLSEFGKVYQAQAVEEAQEQK